MSRSADDRDAEVQRQDELALVHEAFAKEHKAAAEELPDDLADPHRAAADKHRKAAREDCSRAPIAREQSDAGRD